ncbi:MAG: leucyl aminopeptidase [bacterium]
MKYSVSKPALSKLKTDALIIPVFKDETLQELALPKRLTQFIQLSTYDLQDFRAKKHAVLFLASKSQFENMTRLFLLGLGEKETYTWTILRDSFGTLVKSLKKYPIKRAAVWCRPEPVLDEDWSRFGQSVVEGLELGGYEFNTYKTAQDEDKNFLKDARMDFVNVPDKFSGRVRKGADVGKKLSDAVSYARDLGNHPGNVATPDMLAKSAMKMAREYNLGCKILTQADMKRLKMGALLGVAQGSKQPPRMIILEHKKGKRGQAPVVLVGKGVTFDSGGISLKPSKSMDEMKFDMSGGGNVLGIMQAVAALKMPLNLIGVVPAVENLPSGTADKPGDILRSMSGKTIEVLNTDAEGRLILADALTYVERFKPSAVVDMATLTGSVVVALGHEAAGIMANEDALVEELRSCGELAGERVWPLPLFDEYKDQVKGDVADLKNIGKAGAGSSVGAAFLSHFTTAYKWAHLDIAGTAWTTKDLPTAPNGSTGFGVRLLVEWLGGRVGK